MKGMQMGRRMDRWMDNDAGCRRNNAENMVGKEM
jgi:hypothetical protein